MARIELANYERELDKNGEYQAQPLGETTFMAKVRGKKHLLIGVVNG